MKSAIRNPQSAIDAAPQARAGALPTASRASTEVLRAPVEAAIGRAQQYLLKTQRPDGCWVEELQADTTLTSEYLLLRHLLGIAEPAREANLAAYLRATQQADGGWVIYHGGPSEISATVKAYFALRVAGDPGEAPWMARAREWVRAQGGILRSNVFTKVLLALFGQLPWSRVPCMPVELFLLPRWFPFHMYAISYWSRTVLTPLLILFAHRPVHPAPRGVTLDELHVPGGTDPRFAPDPAFLTWRNFFLMADRLLRLYDARPLRPLRRRALEAAHRWMLERMQGSGGLGAIFPAMANSVLALRCLGYPPDHPQFVKAVREIEALEVDDGRLLHLTPCFSPVWDTALAMNALLESGLPPGHPSLARACAWLVGRQCVKPGDWAVNAPGVEPGGWYFQYENEFYPDNDDAAVVLSALWKCEVPDEARKRGAAERGLRWLLAQQSRDGGWASYDRDNNRVYFNHIPFADHGALLDPPTADVTARVVMAMGEMGYGPDHPQMRRALEFLRREQEADGSWYGRWGVNYLYGTWSVLAGLDAMGDDLAGAPHRAAAWIAAVQNPDGGWGESCLSYADPAARGMGPSTASQTAWALMALVLAGQADGEAARRGIAWLLERQAASGAWSEEAFTGTGFPKVFYLRYHMYCKYFPLWALALYRNRLWGVAPPWRQRLDALGGRPALS
jgi:squalene-hopene/tetraprenyl-beta-curcumene cyclase